MASPGLAEVIYETQDPFGGVFGLWGPDVCLDQSVGARFTPGSNYTLDRISLWFMSNDFTGQIHPKVEVTLRADDDSIPGVSVPSNEVLEAWSFNVAAVGWNPVLELMDSIEHPLLLEGVDYWIVAQSQVLCGDDGVWNFASFGTGFAAFSLGYNQAWQPGGSGAALTAIVEGTRLAPGDLDFDGDVDLDDHTVFVTCLAGPNVTTPPAGCSQHQFSAADLKGDGDVDLADFDSFGRAVGN